MIFVSVGTHEDPFDRLVRAAESLAQAGMRVRLQKGPSTVPTPSCDAEAFFTAEQMKRAFESASVVVCHGGPSTIVEAGNYGHLAVVVPRQGRFGEHVDDHQVLFCERLQDRARVVLQIEDLPRVIAEHEDWAAGKLPLGADPGRTEAFAESLERLCLDLSVSPRARPSVRDRLRALRTWIKTRT